MRGATWPVAEPDLLAQIEARLIEMERSGELARLEAGSPRQRAAEAGGTGPGVRHRAGQGENAAASWDPAITVARDIRVRPTARSSPPPARG